MFPSEFCTVLPSVPSSIGERWVLTSQVLAETVGEDEIEQAFADFHRDGLPFTLRYCWEAS